MINKSRANLSSFWLGRCAIAALGISALTLSACGDGGAAASEDPEEFFAGETVTWVVPFSPSGGTDTSARALAPLLSKYLPGNPDVQIENIPGGNGVLGANEFAAMNDERSIMMTSASTNLAVLFDDPAVQFEFSEFTPLAGFPVGSIQYASVDTGVKSAEDLCESPSGLVYGGISPGGGEINRVMGIDMLELDVEKVFGYESQGAVQVAFEQGETNFDGQVTPAYRSSIERLVERGEAVPLYSTGFIVDGELSRDPSYPDLPHAVELYEECFGELPEEEMLEAYEFMVLANQNLQKVVYTQGDVPEAISEAYIEAFEKMQEDPAWENVNETLGGYDVGIGPEFAAEANDALTNPPPDVLDWMIEYASEEYDVELGIGE